MQDRDIEYIIGLDIGTTGVGWCVTDMDGQIQRAKGKHMFGTARFDEANTAAERAQYRHRRRRQARIKARLALLQEMLADDVSKADPLFYMRLSESALDAEDRSQENLYKSMPKPLFMDGSVALLEKGKQAFPIYRLREALVKTKKQADIRYVYMAIAHILTHRGLFLDESANERTQAEIIQEMSAFIYYLNDNYILRIPQGLPGIARFIDELTKSRTKEQLLAKAMAIFQSDPASDDALRAICELLCGESVEISRIFRSKQKIGMISFAQMEDGRFFDALPEEASEELRRLADIYAWKEYHRKDREKEWLSDEMNRRYEQHRKDLKQLKAWIRKYAPDEYDTFFHDDREKTNYNAYTHSRTGSTSGDKAISWNSCTQEVFYAHVSSILLSCGDERGKAEASDMLRRMYDKDGNVIPNGFMPLQKTRINNTIQNYRHRNELEAILCNQEEYYPTLRENHEKIMLLASFRIPAYVGPLRQNANSPFEPWIRYTSDSREPILPWDLEERVDLEKTAEEWIHGAINDCSFIPGDKVLPRNSLIYEEYVLLNELNSLYIAYTTAEEKHEQMTIPGLEPEDNSSGKVLEDLKLTLIDKSLKQRMIQEYFCRKKYPTYKGLIAWIREQPPFRDKSDLFLAISGGREYTRIKGRLSTRVDIERILGRPIDMQKDLPYIEKMIRWSTLYTDRNIYKKRLRRELAGIYTEEQLRQFEGLRYHGWGKLGKRVLTEQICEAGGKKYSVLELMRANHASFMRLYSHSKYGLKDAIEKIRTEGMDDEQDTQTALETLRCSPSVKRGVWQAVKVVNELAKFMGHEPSGIYIRNLREDVSERKKEAPEMKTRYAQVKELYSMLSKGKKKIPAGLKAKLQSYKQGMTDVEYLYFTQLGRCAYTGEEIQLDEPSTYMVDHIIPPHISDDDTLSNLVLVKKNTRISKQPLPKALIRKMQSFWQTLASGGLIPASKLHALMTEEYTDETGEYYIGKQLIDNSLMAERVTSLFRKLWPESNIVGFNTLLIDRLRKEYDLYRVRSLNDLQRAYDAFLVAHIGSFVRKYMRVYTEIGSNEQILRMRKLKENKMDKNETFLARFRKADPIYKNKDGDPAEAPASVWEDNTQRWAYLKTVYNWHDGFVTYKPHEYTGKFYRETIYRHTSETNLISGKQGDRKQVYIAYMAVISYTNGAGERVYELVNVPVYIAARCREGSHDEKLKEFMTGELGYSEEAGYASLSVENGKVLLNQEAEAEIQLEDGRIVKHPVYLKSATEWVSAKQPHVPQRYMEGVWKSFAEEKAALESFDEEDWKDIKDAVEYLAEKLRTEYPIFKSLNKGVEALFAEGTPPLTQEQLLLLVRILLNSMNPGGDAVKGQIAKFNAEKERDGEKLPVLTGDSRLNNKRLKGSRITLINRSVTGLYTTRKNYFIERKKG